MRFFEATHKYPFDWETVSLASFRKYPNDKTPHVQHVEVLNQEIDPETGVLKTERLIMVKQNAPRLMMKLLGGSDSSYVLEYSEVDPRDKTLTMHSTNLTFSNLLTVGEKIVYKPDPEDTKNSTLFAQSAKLSADGVLSRFSSYIEETCLKRFHDNALVGKLGLEQVLHKILAEKRQERGGAGNMAA
ncbi:Phospholipid metabolism protein [Mycoemilia scoparia]|uniref:Phospholipid metabolism protein n=1 Tax=Mycoemilia scoparia TaxID=417184 RepID=A0A9W8A1F7_9FUNG|nr:Phospholipid metabolism protein [Mycoemilia scoparia]